MNRKFAPVVGTFALVLSLLATLLTPAASAQGVAENRTDSAIAAAATGAARGIPVEHKAGGEANLIIPDLSQVSFLGGIHGRSLRAATPDLADSGRTLSSGGSTDSR